MVELNDRPEAPLGTRIAEANVAPRSPRFVAAGVVEGRLPRFLFMAALVVLARLLGLRTRFGRFERASPCVRAFLSWVAGSVVVSVGGDLELPAPST